MTIAFEPCQPKPFIATNQLEIVKANFWIGLYGQNWIVAFDECQAGIEELIGSIRNKQAFYRNGLRAMALIQQAF